MSDNSVTVSNGPSNPVPVSVTNFPTPTVPVSLNAAVSRVLISPTPNVVLSPNPNRRKLIIATEGSVPLYVLFATSVALAAAVSPTNYSRVIFNPNDDLDDDIWDGAVGVMSTSSVAGSIQVTELS